MVNHSCTAKLAQKILRRITRSLKQTRLTGASMEHHPTGECPVTSGECCLTCIGDDCRDRFRRAVELFLVAKKHICCQVQERRKLKGYNIQFEVVNDKAAYCSWCLVDCSWMR